MALVDFNEVVSEAMLTLGIADESAETMVRTFIWRGLQKLGMSEDTIEVCRIDAKNYLLKKPKNMKQFIEIALFDVNDDFIPHIFHAGNKRIYPNLETYSYTVTDDEDNQTTYSVPIDLSENQTSFVIGSNGSSVNYAYVRYYASPIDANGNPVIREEEVEALTLYARYRWSQKVNQNQSEIRANKIDWMEAADYVKAQKKAKDISTDKAKTLASILNRMIPNFNKSRF